MLTAVFFDLDGTIRHNLPSGGEVFADFASQLGLRVRDDDRLRAMRWEHFYWANSTELLNDRQHFDGQEKEFWEQYSQRQLVALGATAAQAAALGPQINRHMMDSYKPASVVPDDALRMLAMLQERGLRLALISNRTRPYQDEIEQLGLARFFSFSLAGGEINAFKPQPEIFRHACRRLGVEPGQAAYVGDNYFADVLGARRAALMPVLYDPRGIFGDPDCPVIRSFDELPAVLFQEAPTAGRTTAG